MPAFYLIVIVLTLGYLSFLAAAPRLAHRMLYHPERGSRVAPEGTRMLAGTKGESIAVLHLPNPEAKFTLWHFHGNAEDLGNVEPLLREWQAAGFAVISFDYPGFGRSTGQLSEAAVYAAARTVRQYLRRELGIPAARTIIYGHSLGNGPAVQMAVEEKVAGLVLHSSFVTAYRVVTRWPLLPFDQYRNLTKLAALKIPVLVMHGSADRVIPVWHGRRLFEVANEPKRHLWVANAGHSDLISVSGEGYWATLREFSEVCASRAANAR